MIDKFTKKFVEKKVEEKVEDIAEEISEDIESRASYETVSVSNDAITKGSGQLNIVAEAYSTKNELTLDEFVPSITGSNASAVYKFTLLSSVTNTMTISVSDPSIMSIEPIITG